MSAGHAFATTWGALPLKGGGARFRLWAPAMRSVRLRAAEGGAELAMSAGDDGWFSLETDAVAVGGGYSFVLDDGMCVPDPAAREQTGGVHDPSRLIDPLAYTWRETAWTGRPWEEAVIYELHTGTFTPEGDFDGVRARLDHLARLGVTAIELMPVAQFAGWRGWGYDGVLPYAPHPAYGGVDGLKHLVDAAHERGLMVLLDVVYNHFGPEGSYLHAYAPDFFHPEHTTPWGAALAYEREPVWRFFLENALYWIEEFRFDGLRLDAIDQIRGEGGDRLLRNIARGVREHCVGRHVHLTTEDERNIVGLHEREADGRVALYAGEWNDDFHHAAHVLATGESEGYYADYVADRIPRLGRALAEGFIYQGEPSIHHGGASRGCPSAHLPSTAFIDFLQNHDQIGNRAFGERLSDLAAPAAVEALTAVLLLAPAIPLLFMGEEWGETRPFCFFTDFHGELGDTVREGRRREFRHWSGFRDAATRDLIPDPNAMTTFEASRLDWGRAETEEARGRLAFVSSLLALRRREIVPRLGPPGARGESHRFFEGGSFCVHWRLADGSRLGLYANLDGESWSMPAGCSPDSARERLLFEISAGVDLSLRAGELPGWSVVVRIDEGGAIGR